MVALPLLRGACCCYICDSLQGWPAVRRTSPIVVSWALELVGGQGLSMMSRVISELLCCSQPSTWCTTLWWHWRP